MKMRDTDKTDRYVAEHPGRAPTPKPGRKALYVNTEHTIRFKGMTAEETLPLIEYLQDHCTRP